MSYFGVLPDVKKNVLFTIVRHLEFSMKNVAKNIQNRKSDNLKTRTREREKETNCGKHYLLKGTPNVCYFWTDIGTWFFVEKNLNFPEKLINTVCAHECFYFFIFLTHWHRLQKGYIENLMKIQEFFFYCYCKLNFTNKDGVGSLIATMNSGEIDHRTMRLYFLLIVHQYQYNL